MLPDHLRALRTSAVLAILTCLLTLGLGLALAGQGHSRAAAVAFAAAMGATLIGVRCAMAFDAARRRRQL